VLTDAEGEILAALCDVLIPADDYPSASQAGAVEFFDRRLSRSGVRELPLVRGGLAALDATARATGAAFPALPPAAREVLVARVEQGHVPGAIWHAIDAPAFFRHVLARTMQSYYADPRHGGNRDRVSWRMVGLPDPPVRGRHKDG
jgi:gluconate 2-dehydrogenase gamma chain